MGSEELYQKALSIRKQIQGDEHPEVGDSKLEFAELFKVKRDYNAAEKLYRENLAILQKLLDIIIHVFQVRFMNLLVY